MFPSVTSSIKNTPVPATSVTSLSSSGLKQHAERDYLWLQRIQIALQETSPLPNTLWTAYHANQQDMLASRATCPTELLPFFLERAHTLAMIKHSMDVAKNSVQHFNPVPIPMVTFHQPPSSLTNQIQGKWPQEYGEGKFVTLFGGLHNKMAALKTLDD